MNYYEQENKQNIQIDITPHVVKEGDAEKLEFDVKYEDFESKASLVELPCILESQKSIDMINLFKSNDICQMILVHDPNKEPEIPESQAKKVVVEEKDTKQIKYLANSGITAPTTNIRKKFFRQPPKVDPQLVQEVEKEIIDTLSKYQKAPYNKR